MSGVQRLKPGRCCQTMSLMHSTVVHRPYLGSRSAAGVISSDPLTTRGGDLLYSPPPPPGLPLPAGFPSQLSIWLESCELLSTRPLKSGSAVRRP
jgi:hypothetical protein